MCAGSRRSRQARDKKSSEISSFTLNNKEFLVSQFRDDLARALNLVLIFVFNLNLFFSGRFAVDAHVLVLLAHFANLTLFGACFLVWFMCNAIISLVTRLPLCSAIVCCCVLCLQLLYHPS